MKRRYAGYDTKRRREGSERHLFRVTAQTLSDRAAELSDGPLTAKDRKTLNALVPSRRGRPPGRTRGPIWDAELWAAQHVKMKSKAWCRTQGRRRVSSEMRTKLIADAVEAAAREFTIDPALISADNIRTLLKRSLPRR